MKKIKNIIKKNKFNISLKTIVLIILLYILFATDFLYFSAYTIDYLLNRSNYTFKEEGQFTDNKFIDSNSFLSTYMDSTRKSKLAKLPTIECERLPEIPINELNTKNVYKISNGFTQPFVVRGLIKDFECVKKWDLNYFEKEYGDIELLSFSEQNSISYKYNDGSKLKVCNSENNLCSLKEVIQGIRNSEPVYVNNISKLFSVSEQAKNELDLEKIGKIMNESMFKTPRESNRFVSQLFFGGKNTGTNLHSASNINFFFNIKGKKHWGFIDPKYTHLIKCQTSNQGLFAGSEDDYFSEDINNPFLKIPRYETILEPGDFLFNPAWYWHAVKNKTDYTIAVANRYISNTSYLNPFEELPIFNNKFFTFLQFFSPSFVFKILQKNDENDQQYYGNIIDQEIINNITQTKAM